MTHSPSPTVSEKDFRFLDGTNTAILCGDDPTTAYVISESQYVIGKMVQRYGLPDQSRPPYCWKVARNGIVLPKPKREFSPKNDFAPKPPKPRF